MRVHLAGPLIRVVGGTDPMVNVSARLGRSISADDEKAINQLAGDIQRKFNSDMAPRGQTIDYVSVPLIVMPDEFSFSLDVESLPRLARETLIQFVPLYAQTWEIEYDQAIEELWVGGDGETLTKSERANLMKETDEIRKLPIRSRSFAFGPDIIDFPREVAEAALLERGARIVPDGDASRCDYYVTDDIGTALKASKNGASRVISSLVQKLMIDLS